MSKYLVSSIGNSDSKLDLLGGKGEALLKLKKIGIKVPKTYIINTDAHKDFIAQNAQLDFYKVNKDKINKDISTEDLHRVFKEIRSRYECVKLPNSIKDDIATITKETGNKLLAVRSSANCEDGPKATWAGQFDTYLNTPNTHLEKRILNCWSSIFSLGVYHYAKNNLKGQSSINMGVVIQEMVTADISGVCFTSNPVNKNKDEIIIEYCDGLGEVLVSGQIVPHSYTISKPTSDIINFRKGRQKKILRNGRNNQIEDFTDVVSELSNKKLSDLHKMAVKLENIFDAPQDFEWAFSGDELFILQSRPISTL